MAGKFLYAPRWRPEISVGARWDVSHLAARACSTRPLPVPGSSKVATNRSPSACDLPGAVRCDGDQGVAAGELGTLWRTHRNPRWLFPNRCGDEPLNQRVLSHAFAAAADAAGFHRGVMTGL